MSFVPDHSMPDPVGLQHVALDQRALALPDRGERRAEQPRARALARHLALDRGDDLAADRGIERRGDAEVDLGEPQDVAVAFRVALEHDRVAHVEEAVLEHTQVDGVGVEAQPDARREPVAVAARLAEDVACEAHAVGHRQAHADRRREDPVVLDHGVLGDLSEHAGAAAHHVAGDPRVEQPGGPHRHEARVRPHGGRPRERVEQLLQRLGGALGALQRDLDLLLHARLHADEAVVG